MPAKIILNGKKRVSMEIVKPGDRAFVSSTKRHGSTHCTITNVTKEKKLTTIHFKEVGCGGDDAFSGTHRDKHVYLIDIYK